ncbi:TFIIH complex kinase subunit CCL1 [Aspergillus fijiensis CBS 313.89]|uniref:RNA polymerase II holoenzyme cyclin-like subunit n=1 Tax=Aspergillus fijiensis CBS 313.89 TaxID=1448319 RepID=A0A8G1RMI7_9EURO|nr:RNA polymerase II transcription initiation [Aspergillus fijiensis CBS 313.89]RAK75494.1 RNA polymerase II transcription initiation [Aspergillus fijiensis CBS 313.89]
MIEDDFYRTSSQYRLWSFTAASLQAQRAITNAVASDRVRAAIRRAQEARRSATSSATGTPVPEVEGSTSTSTNHPAKAEEKPIECLTPEEEQQTVSYYCEQIIQLGEAYKPPLPTIVRATAIQYLRRFYLTNSPMTYHPKQIMPCALFLATKTDNYYMSLRQFADGVPGDTTAEDIIAPEFVVMQSLRFTFDVRHPFRGLEGGIMELQALAAGQGQPAPHLAATTQTQTPESLQRGLLALPLSSSSKNITDRIARAHHTTREILKSAAQITDVYFLFTPAQIWLAALMLADRALAEYYLDTKLGTSAPSSSVQEAEAADGLAALRPKLLRTLNDCAAMLQAYKPLASDPDQMKTLRRIIGKKLYHCQNPEKVNLGGAGQKRIPAAALASSAAAAAAAAATPTGGVDSGASESEMERLAKKRKLETAAESSSGSKDIFGGELVMQRTKER